MQLELQAGSNISLTVVPGTAVATPKLIIAAAGQSTIVAPNIVTTATILTAAQQGQVFTSLGATGDPALRAITLPASAAAGTYFWFNTYLTEGLQVNAPGTDEILLGDQTTPDGGYVTTSEANQRLCLYKLASGVWTAREYSTGWRASE